MRKVVSFIIILSVLVLGVSCRWKKDDEVVNLVPVTGDITFKIESREHVVSDAKVNLEFYGAKVTDQNGLVMFSEVLKGTYEVNVKKDGYKEFIYTFVFDGQDQIVPIQLETESILPPKEVQMVIGDGQLTLDWSPPAVTEFLAGYQILKSLDGSTFEILAELDASETTYTDSQVENGRIYYYVIQSLSVFDEISNRTPIKSAIPNATLDFDLIYSKIDYQFGTLNIYLLEEGREIELIGSSAREYTADYDTRTGQILYTSNETGKSQIYVMDLSGENTRQLSFENMGVKEPSFSQDGSQITYVSQQDQYIYIMTSFGTERSQIVQGNYPILLPSGELMFIKEDANGVENFYKVDQQGEGLTQLTFYQSSVKKPALSPDGKQVAYIRDGKVCIMNVDGTDEQYITKSTNGSYVESPGWSPDGSEILYVSNANEEQIPTVYLKGVVDDPTRGRELVGYGIKPIAF